MLIDTHCHLYLEDFDEDLKETLLRCEYNDVRKIFLPAIDSETHQRLVSLSQLSNANCELLPMMGLHPCSVKQNFEDELNTVQKFLDEKKFYAIGEIGLDYYWDVSFKEQQIYAFEKQLQWSINRKLPVAIHSRNSTSDCIISVAKFNGTVTGIFHCFSGSLEEARQVIELGMYLGIGGVVTYKNTNLRDVLKEVGLNRIVLETDSPYLTPVPHRGKRNEPSYVKLVCKAIAEALNKSYEEVAEITTQNALDVFSVEK
ncbi:MAG: TatD family hydrolase [Chitinophagales bacterium]|nr:TatD family hydrolase [Chitinophagales bacterium]